MWGMGKTEVVVPVQPGPDHPFSIPYMENSLAIIDRSSLLVPVPASSTYYTFRTRPHLRFNLRVLVRGMCLSRA